MNSRLATIAEIDSPPCIPSMTIGVFFGTEFYEYFVLNLIN
jgi:hypothetical protein